MAGKEGDGRTAKGGYGKRGGVPDFFIGRVLIACLFLIVIISASVTFFSKNEMDLMINNETGGTIKISSCQLNNLSLQNCIMELKEKQNGFVNPHQNSYPKNNFFQIQVNFEKEIKKYSCNFKKIDRDCMTEMQLTYEKLTCASCTSIY
jgi:hypothetical protein